MQLVYLVSLIYICEGALASCKESIARVSERHNQDMSYIQLVRYNHLMPTGDESEIIHRVCSHLEMQ